MDKKTCMSYLSRQVWAGVGTPSLTKLQVMLHPPTTYGFFSGGPPCLLLLFLFIRQSSESWLLSLFFFPLYPHFMRQKNDLLAPEHNLVGVGWFSVLSGRPVFASISLSRGVVSEDDNCSLTLLMSFWWIRSRKLCPTRSDCWRRNKDAVRKQNKLKNENVSS